MEEASGQFEVRVVDVAGRVVVGDQPFADVLQEDDSPKDGASRIETVATFGALLCQGYDATVARNSGGVRKPDSLGSEARGIVGSQ